MERLIDIREYAHKYNKRFVLSDKYPESGQTAPIIDMEEHPDDDETFFTELVYSINELNDENKRLREENERLKWSNKILRANRKDCEKGRVRDRKSFNKFDEFRLGQIRDLHQTVKDEYMKRVTAENELKKIKKAKRDYTSRRLI